MNMTIDRKAFFNYVRPNIFSNNLKPAQVQGIEMILNEWEKRALPDIRKCACMLGTSKWETASTMLPIEEYGKGAGRPYGYPTKTGQTYYGRGFVQLTWEENYRTMTRLIGVDLVNRPELALDPPIAVKILFEGMLNAESGVGDFTNKSLDDYFTSSRSDWVGSRAVINGTDHAVEIAETCRDFFDALYGALL
jgi:putative chitinase